VHVFNFISSISEMPQEAQTSATSPPSPLIISTCPSFFNYDYFYYDYDVGVSASQLTSSS
jgi:hypothetical protein